MLYFLFSFKKKKAFLCLKRVDFMKVYIKKAAVFIFLKLPLEKGCCLLAKIPSLH